MRKFLVVLVFCVIQLGWGQSSKIQEEYASEFGVIKVDPNYKTEGKEYDLNNPADLELLKEKSEVKDQDSQAEAQSGLSLQDILNAHAYRKLVEAPKRILLLVYGKSNRMLYKSMVTMIINGEEKFKNDVSFLSINSDVNEKDMKKVLKNLGIKWIGSCVNVGDELVVKVLKKETKRVKKIVTKFEGKDRELLKQEIIEIRFFASKEIPKDLDSKDMPIEYVQYILLQKRLGFYEALAPIYSNEANDGVMEK